MSFPRYQTYKDSGFSWLGQIPSHWRTLPLWTIFQRVKKTGFIDEELLSVYRDHGVIPKSSRDDNHNRSSDDLDPYQLVDVGNLVINKMKAFQGSVAISNYRGIVSPAYFVYKGDHSNNSRFLHYLMRSTRYIFAYRSISKGIRPNQWDLEPQEHSRLPLVIPTVSEQKLIADFLDNQIEKIESLIGEQLSLIELLREKIQAVISNAITKGVDPTVELIDSGVEWLGKIPKHWKLTSVKYNSTIIGRIGFRGYTKEDIVDEGEGAITLSPSNLIDGEISLDSCTFISWEKFHESPEIQIAPGDVVMVKTGSSYGKVAIFDNSELPEITINPQLVIFKKIKVDSQFFYYFLKSSYVNSLIKSSNTGGTIPTLTQEFLGNIKIVIPSNDEQKLIVDYLNKKNTEFNLLIRESEKVINLLNERKSTLISAAVTGQIDVRDYQIKEAA